MNLEKILAQYDAMFGTNSLEEIEDYLVNTITEAKEKSEYGIVITLLNEIIGFCRDTTQKEKALRYCEELQKILKLMKLEGRIDYATSLLNVANAYRAFGLFEESLRLYEIVEETYKQQIPPTDFMYASLYNNWSLLFQEMQDYESARDMLLKALEIADSYEEAVIPQATTRANLAATLLQIGTDEAYEQAIRYLKEALAVHEKDGGGDFHYGAVLVAMGDAYSFKKDYVNAAAYYEKGLAEIEKHVGRTDNYARVKEKFNYVMTKLQDEKENPVFSEEKNDWVSNLERSRTFYEKYGKTMIHEKFADYEDRIAVGMVGEGSDCFGYDDKISTDHDYEIGFCMWLLQSDYEEIGEELQREYEKLIQTYLQEDGVNLFLSNRRGIFGVNDFYNRILGTDMDYEKMVEQGIADKMLISYDSIAEYQLATATNGEIYADKQGVFTGIRECLLKYYPQAVWRRKLAQSLHDFAQYGQSNYARMMARKDYVTARICVGKAMESAMDLVYLLRKTYAPYYKWKRKGLEVLAEKDTGDAFVKGILCTLDELAVLPCQAEAWESVTYDAAEINTEDKCVVLFEKIAATIVKELTAQNLIRGKDTFLENYISQILRGKNMDIVEKIVELEWKQFDKVKNEGGRASCQDDYQTFSIMRKSQYLTWPDELLDSFCNDLLSAENKGWNLIMEKYARMMKSTTPEKYEELKKDLPVLNEERIAIQEEIVKIQVGWMEEFAAKYPKMAGNARSIHTAEDTPFNTSYETYLRGELGTYSENTFILYGRFITGLLRENRNLAYETMENTAKLYGYESVEEAEERL
ncbi:MAG: DUF4125 family protein [Lachnospiraceae bacterium]|nr:DUF4125 family protein [Lachnospiraceae bacterium]